MQPETLEEIPRVSDYHNANLAIHEMGQVIITMGPAGQDAERITVTFIIPSITHLHEFYSGYIPLRIRTERISIMKAFYRTAIVALIVASCCALPAMAEEKRGPAITSKVFFDVSIDGKEAGTDHQIE